MNPYVSIIIPVYNVDRYLGICIESIIKQTYKNWELILVDDGSNDSSGKICDQFCTADSRIKVFHKTNGGVSSARNIGLEHACGEWITFIDADDFVSQTYIAALIQPTRLHNDLDLVHAGCTNWKEGKVIGINQEYDEYIGIEPSIVFEKFRGLTVSKLFRLENVNKWSDGLPLRFDEKLSIAEDMLFTLEYLHTVRKFAFISEIGYYYRQDNTYSITKQPSKNKVEDVVYMSSRILSTAFDYAVCHSIDIKFLPLRRKALAQMVFQKIIVLLDNQKRFKDKMQQINRLVSEAEMSLLRYYPYHYVWGSILLLISRINCLSLFCRACMVQIYYSRIKNILLYKTF